jgi:hypothetical protein
MNSNTSSGDEIFEDTYPSDKPTIFANLWARFAYTCIAWLILGLGINQGFFTALMLFYFPLLMDYAKFKPDTKLRRKIRGFGLWTSGIGAAGGLVATTGLMSVTTVDGQVMAMVSKNFVVFAGETFPIKYIWFLVGVNVLLTGIDPFVYESKAEKMALTKVSQGLGG